MFCAPKPSATPTIDVPAMNGARSICSSLRISRNAMTRIVNEIADFSTEPIVAARCVRRSDSSPVDSRNALASMRSLNGRRMRGTSPPAAGRTRRSIIRRSSARMSRPRR